MLRSQNVGFSCTRISGTTSVLRSRATAIVPSILRSRYQHPILISQYNASTLFPRDRNLEDPQTRREPRERKDHYRTIAERGKRQRSSSKEALILAKTNNNRDKLRGRGRGVDEVEDDEEHEGYEEGGYPKSVPKKRMSEAQFEKEMQYIQRDRVALADRVKQLLKLGHEEKATMLVRASESAKIDCIASWNALMKHKMSSGSRKEAMGLFNDMKKRGRFPNEQTFTTLLSGLSASPSKSSSEIALKLYESMSNENSIAKPNIIHVNAVLNVFARNGDMKNLWQFAGDVPEHGERAPNSVTYTIILNAIRTHVLQFTDTLDPEKDARALKEITRRKRIAVSSGKKLWSDIIRKWRKGDAVLDSKLVVSMARLLAIEASEASYFDILSLYNQCMGLPIPEVIQPDIARLRSAQKELPESDESLSKEEIKRKEKEKKMLEEIFDPVDLEEIRAALKEKPGAKKNPHIAYPSPSNTDLTLLLETCQNMAKNGMASGRHYWVTLTSSKENGYGLKPDSVSCHEYLRLLRRHRASAESLKLIQEQMVPGHLVVEKTFIIALSTCSRDRNNHNILNTASKLLDISASALNPDTNLVSRYIQLVRALLSKNRLISDSDQLKKDLSKHSKAERSPSPAELHQARLLQAITHLRPRIQETMELLAFGFIKYQKKPKVKASDSSPKEGESSQASSTVAAEEEDDIMADKALNRYSKRNNRAGGYGAALRGPDPDKLLHILWHSHSLYKRALGAQQITSSPSEDFASIASVSSFLSDADKVWLTKDCNRLAKFAPYFKELELRAKKESEAEADYTSDQSEDV